MTKKAAGSSEDGAVVCGAVLYCSGALIFSVMPAYLGNVGQLLHVSPAALGMLSAAELWSIALASLTGPLWIGRFNWRTLARLGAVTALAGQLASLWVTEFYFLLTIRIITGMLGEGLLLALGYSILGRTRNVERSFGLAYAASIVIGTICLYSSPEVDRALGGIGVLAALAVLAVAALFISFIVPDNSSTSAAGGIHPTTPHSAGWRSLGALALVGQSVWYAGAGGFWSFAEELAAHNAVPTTYIAQAMGIGTAAALMGTLLAVGLSNRVGRTLPTLISTVLIVIAVFAFMSSGEFVKVTTELALFNVFWACGTIYMTATACSFDSSGKIAVLVPAFQTIGMALGTLVLGRFMKDFGFGSTPWIVGCFAALGMALVLLCLILAKRDLAAQSARKTLEST